MKSFKLFCIVMVLAFLASANVAQATVDVPDYSATISPDFSVSDQTYGKFESAEIEMDTAVNNMIISVDTETSKTALFRGYARFKYSETGKWTRYMAFDREYHFSSIKPLSAYQVMFVVRDPEMGKNSVNKVSVQGNFIPEETMEYFIQKPAPFKAAKLAAKPSVVSRSAWGARPPKSGYSSHSPQRIVVHHTYIPNQSQYKGAASIRGIQNYHMDNAATGWADIGYHFLIGPEGTIYQGRPETVVGAHCSPNTNSVGVCLIGDYDPGKDPIPAVMEKSLINLLAWLTSNYGVDPRTNIYGHCDFSTKSCPGKTVYARLPQYKDLLMKNIGEVK